MRTTTTTYTGTVTCGAGGAGSALQILLDDLFIIDFSKFMSKFMENLQMSNDVAIMDALKMPILSIAELRADEVRLGKKIEEFRWRSNCHHGRPSWTRK